MLSRGHGRVWSVAFVLLATCLGTVLLACGPDAPEGDPLVSYERAWSDGLIESQSIWADGRIEMTHGGNPERFELAADDLERIEAALDRPIPTGSPDDSPKRTLTLEDGTVIEAPRPEADSVTELLERLLDSHVL